MFCYLHQRCFTGYHFRLFKRAVQKFLKNSHEQVHKESTFTKAAVFKPFSEDFSRIRLVHYYSKHFITTANVKLSVKILANAHYHTQNNVRYTPNT